MGAVAIGAILFALFLVVVAALVWQEARRDPVSEPPVYLLGEAARFVLERLDEDTTAHLGIDEVRNVLEWGIHYNQVIAIREDRHRAVVGSGESIPYIMERAAVEGLELDPLHIAEVIAAETDYLVHIGAIGPPVGEEAP